MTHAPTPTPKHLTTGDAFPALPAGDGKLILLSMRFCPFAQRAHLMLERKALPYHVVNIHLQQKPAWLTEYSRQGKVPALGLTNEPDTPYLYESLLIVDYLDEKYGPSLYPTDALAKAQDRLWIERFAGSVAPAFYRIAYHGANAVAADAVTVLGDAFEPFEAELKRRGTTFFAGATGAGMLDYMIWPWVERVAALALRPEAERFVLDDAQRFGALAAWQRAMRADAAVQKWLLAPEVHYAFMESHNAGATNYDMLAEA